MYILNNEGLSFKELQSLVSETSKSKKELLFDVYLIHSNIQDVVNIMTVHVNEFRMACEIYRCHEWMVIDEGVLEGFSGPGYVHNKTIPNSLTKIATMTVDSGNRRQVIQMSGGDPSDQYYHICGPHSYLDIAKGLMFPLKFVYDFGMVSDESELSDWKEIIELVPILDDYIYVIHIRDRRLA